MRRPDGNLFAGISGTPGERTEEELVERIAAGTGAGVRVERIVSRGHASPDGFWYDQSEREWVVVLSGRARLRFEGDEDDVDLGPGDYVDIPAHTRHRVQWTAPGEDTVWLAVLYDAGGAVQRG